MKLVTVPYKPRDIFKPFHSRTSRWAVIVAHRRCGKTVACINDLIRRATLCEHPVGRYAYIAPLYNQAKDVAWAYLKQFSEPLWSSPPNETELRVDLVTGARIRLYGADNPDRLRGLALDGVVLDEYADMAPSVWGEVIRPALADRQGWATWIGTPKGRNAFYEQFQRAVERGDYTALLRASDTGILPQGELDAARLDMTPEQYAQEFECSFEASIMGAYFGKEVAEAERSGRLKEVLADASLKTHTAWDLGIGDSTAIWWWQATGNEIRIIDFYENSGQSLEHYVKVINSKPYTKGKAYVPHDARVRELGTGRTRIEVLKELGLDVALVPDHKLMDGINAARMTIPLCWFDASRTKDGLEALRQYRADYDEKVRAFKNTPKHDWTSHAADAFRYLCMAWRMESKPEPVKKLPAVKEIGHYTIEDAWAEAHRSEDRRRI